MTYRIGQARVVSSAILLFIIASGSSGYARARDLAVSEARELVMEALEPSARKLPKLAIDPYTNARAPAPHFYEFAVTWDNPNGAVVVGFFGVNRVTGDVWKLVVCEKVESASLKRLQTELRKKIGLSEKEMRERTDDAPCEP